MQFYTTSILSYLQKYIINYYYFTKFEQNTFFFLLLHSKRFQNKVKLTHVVSCLRGMVKNLPLLRGARRS